MAPTKSAERLAYDHLRDRILRGEISGGTPIRQQDVADALGLSRIPVRDALRHLSAEGLVKIESNRRVIVTSVTLDDVQEIFSMRSVLEGLAARIAVSNFSDLTLQRLTFLVERMERAEAHKDEWLRLHEEFHDFICSQSKMPRLRREVERLRVAVEPYLRAFITTHRMAELRSSKHRGLLIALRKRNGDLAERAMRAHVECAFKEICVSIKDAKQVQSAAGQTSWALPS
jgi:DNA-binding GntR family transcriptional regulator